MKTDTLAPFSDTAAGWRRALYAPLAEKERRRKSAVDFLVREVIDEASFRDQAAEIDSQRKAVEDRLAELEPKQEPSPPPVPDDLLAELRRRLEAGLDQRTRQEIVRTLVKQITLYTEAGEDGRAKVRAVIEYRFPSAPPCVLPAGTGRGSWPPPA